MPLQVEYVLVGGGGAGACSDNRFGSAGGGGGAGGVIEGSIYLSVGLQMPIIVGAGGVRNLSGFSQQMENHGTETAAFGVSATGGGAGVNANGGYVAPRNDGGSGGGGVSQPGQGFQAGKGVVGQGHDGGVGGGNVFWPEAGCAGGGGAGAVGGSSPPNTIPPGSSVRGYVAGGQGGPGVALALLAPSATIYAEGGAGGSFGFLPGASYPGIIPSPPMPPITPTGGSGGIGGGSNQPGGDAAPQRGGGGGGSGSFADVDESGSYGGAGGSGVVLARYLTGLGACAGGTITTNGPYTVHTFTANGTLTVIRDAPLPPPLGGSDVSVASPPLWRLFDHDGRPLKGGLLFTFRPGSGEPVTVYKDYAQTVPWPNPIVLDSEGRIHRPIFAPSDTRVRYMLTDAQQEVLLWDADAPPPTVGTSVPLDHWLSFTPTWLNDGTPNKLNDGVLVGRYRYTGLTTINFTLRLDFGPNTQSGSGFWSFGNFPGTAQASVAWYPAHAGGPSGGHWNGVAGFVRPHSIVIFDGLPVQNFVPAYSGTNPFTWGPGMFLRVSGSYTTAPPANSLAAVQATAFLGFRLGPVAE